MRAVKAAAGRAVPRITSSVEIPRCIGILACMKSVF